MANKKPKAKKTVTTDEIRAERAKRSAEATRKKKEKVSTLDYWKGVKQEMSKVIWPTRKELGAFTVVVIVTCAAFALGFWAIDSGFLAILKQILGVTLG